MLRFFERNYNFFEYRKKQWEEIDCLKTTNMCWVVVSCFSTVTVPLKECSRCFTVSTICENTPCFGIIVIYLEIYPMVTLIMSWFLIILFCWTCRFILTHICPCKFWKAGFWILDGMMNMNTSKDYIEDNIRKCPFHKVLFL